MAQPEQVMCWIIEQMLKAVREGSYMSLPRLCQHLALLGYFTALQEERRSQGIPVIRIDDGTIT